MRNKRVLIGALGVAGVLGVTASAFTATSTIYDSAVNVGSVTQSQTGITVTDVDYTYDQATDETSAVIVTTSELLDDAAATMKVSVNGGGLQDCDAAAQTDPDNDNVDDGVTDFSVTTCTFGAAVANVTSVQFVVEG
jgi:hypothetical protein